MLVKGRDGLLDKQWQQDTCYCGVAQTIYLMKGADITSLNANNSKASNIAKLASDLLVRPLSLLLEETDVTLGGWGEL